MKFRALHNAIMQWGETPCSCSVHVNQFGYTKHPTGHFKHSDLYVQKQLLKIRTGAATGVQSIRDED